MKEVTGWRGMNEKGATSDPGPKMVTK